MSSQITIAIEQLTAILMACSDQKLNKLAAIFKIPRFNPTCEDKKQHATALATAIAMDKDVPTLRTFQLITMLIENLDS